MTYLKRLIFILILCFLIGIIVSLFLPSELILKKTAVINADEIAVQKQLKTFNYQKIAGYDLLEEDEGWSFNLLDEGLEITSSIKFSFGFNPLTKFNAVFDKSEMDAVFQQRFDSLKVVLEELPKIQGVVVEKKIMEADIWFLSIRDTISQLNMNNAHGKFYEEIKRFLTEDRQLEVVEPPLVIYHFWSDTIVDIEVGVSVKDSTLIGSQRITMNKIEQSAVVTAVHQGAYDRLPETYFGINEWMRKNRVIVTGPPWEVYLTDPSTEANPKKWKTAIYFPIE